jgi:hypothetical protein
MLLSQRLQARHAAWYPPKPRWWAKKDNPLHVGLEFRRVMRATDSDTAWRCCDFWQRKLFNKWNIREFAKKHDCRVPKLYWHGRDVSSLELKSLPEHFVVRTTRGSDRRTTLVMARGVDLLENRRYDPHQLRARLSELLSSMKSRPSSQLLVEEFVQNERGLYMLPFDHRLHVFNGKVGAIQVSDITGAIDSDPDPGVDRTRVREGSFHADWTPFKESLSRRGVPAPDMPAPICLPEMLEFAETLGKAVGSYVRVDLYATPAGAVVGEFALHPGRGMNDFADELLGRLWSENIPDGV